MAYTGSRWLTILATARAKRRTGRPFARLAELEIDQRSGPAMTGVRREQSRAGRAAELVEETGDEVGVIPRIGWKRPQIANFGGAMRKPRNPLACRNFVARDAPGALA